MKFIFVITLSLCSIYKSKCPKECDVTVDHNHLISICKDSLVAIKEKKQAVEFVKANSNIIKKIDSVKVQ